MRFRSIIPLVLVSACAQGSKVARIAEPEIIDPSTCAKVIIQRPTEAYDARWGRARFIVTDSLGGGHGAYIKYTPIVLAARADTGIDPFHCGKNR